MPRALPTEGGVGEGGVEQLSGGKCTARAARLQRTVAGLAHAERARELCAALQCERHAVVAAVHAARDSKTRLRGKQRQCGQTATVRWKAAAARRN